MSRNVVGSYYTGKYVEPVIPNGYRYAYGNWNEGYVIERISDGSLFTFVPVGSLKDNGTFDGIKFNQRFGRRKWFGEDEKLGNEPIKQEIWNQFHSVREYGGFYISTYQISRSIFAKPQSLEGRKPWTYLDFNCAREIAEHFEESSTIGSHLVYGAEYDTMLQWFLETKAMSIEDLTVLNRAGNGEPLSGNNIFNIAGTTSEWTQEKVNSRHMLTVIRGGTNITPKRRKPIADRSSCAIYRKDPYIGFRIALYIP